MIRKNIFSIIVALMILYLSLADSQTFDKVSFINIPHLDKIIHFLMYSGFMSVIILENQKSLISTSQLFLIGLIPFGYGVLMELLQMTVTSSRSGSIYDVLFNTAGVVASLLLWLLIRPYLNTRS